MTSLYGRRAHPVLATLLIAAVTLFAFRYFDATGLEVVSVTFGAVALYLVIGRHSERKRKPTASE